jgi:hypothetical protein
LIAEALPENLPMLKMFQGFRQRAQTKRRTGFFGVTLNVF